MKKIIFLPILFLLVACGPSDEEKQNVATITCNIISETMDPAMKIKEMNAAREEIQGEPYLFGEDKINEALIYDLCVNLVLMSEPEYEKVLLSTKEERRKQAEEIERQYRRTDVEMRLTWWKENVVNQLNNNAERYCESLKGAYENLQDSRSIDESARRIDQYWEYEDYMEIVDTYNENNLDQKCDVNFEDYIKLYIEVLND